MGVLGRRRASGPLRPQVEDGVAPPPELLRHRQGGEEVPPRAPAGQEDHRATPFRLGLSAASRASRERRPTAKPETKRLLPP